MSKFNLKALHTEQEKETFIKEIQKAFQQSFEAENGPFDKTILPREDVEESLASEGAKAFFAEQDGEIVGGVLVQINPETQINSLDLLYVRPTAQNSGVGHKIWAAIEGLFPDTKIWETHTPYYEKRNIHFYVNRLGFHIVEFFHPGHRDPHQSGEHTGNIPEEQDYFFRFEKYMQKK